MAKHWLTGYAVGVLVLLAVSNSMGATASLEIPRDLERNFSNPPASAQTWVNWFWLDGNISKEGITADLEAMQRVGIGGAMLMDITQYILLGRSASALHSGGTCFNTPSRKPAVFD
jgi:hypothetical protein